MSQRADRSGGTERLPSDTDPGFAAVRRKWPGDLGEHLVRRLRGQDDWYVYRDDPKAALAEAKRVQAAEIEAERQFRDLERSWIPRFGFRHRPKTAAEWRAFEEAALEDRWAAIHEASVASGKRCPRQLFAPPMAHCTVCYPAFLDDGAGDLVDELIPGPGDVDRSGDLTPEALARLVKALRLRLATHGCVHRGAEPKAQHRVGSVELPLVGEVPDVALIAVELGLRVEEIGPEEIRLWQEIQEAAA